MFHLRAFFGFRVAFARDHILEDYFATGLTSVLAHCQGLPTEEHESVTGAFTQGKAAVVSLLTLKAQFWALIPWKLAGLAHWDTALAAECARTCIAQYEKRPADAERLDSMRLIPYRWHTTNILWIRGRLPWIILERHA